jgi:hypothetical protein
MTSVVSISDYKNRKYNNKQLELEANTIFPELFKILKKIGKENREDINYNDDDFFIVAHSSLFAIQYKDETVFEFRGNDGILGYRDYVPGEWLVELRNLEDKGV